MADTSTQLILDALRRAVAEPMGLPLFAGRARPGLFANAARARQAAQRCKDDALLGVVRTGSDNRSSYEVCTITEKGLAYLLEQTSPKGVLHDLAGGLAKQQEQLGELVDTAKQTQANIAALKTVVDKVLQQIHHAAPRSSDNGVVTRNGTEPWMPLLLSHLHHRENSKATDDCPLPVLFRAGQSACAELTIGLFHDGLRRLHDEGRIYLHPWTGPLSEIPEPPYALLVGHEIAYYASLR